MTQPSGVDRTRARRCFIVFSEIEAERVAQALADEREKAAKIVEKFFDKYVDDCDHICDIGEAIRKGGE